MSETEMTARQARRELGNRLSRKRERKAVDRMRMGIVTKKKTVVMQSKSRQKKV